MLLFYFSASYTVVNNKMWIYDLNWHPTALQKNPWRNSLINDCNHGCCCSLLHSPHCHHPQELIRRPGFGYWYSQSISLCWHRNACARSLVAQSIAAALCSGIHHVRLESEQFASHWFLCSEVYWWKHIGHEGIIWHFYILFICILVDHFYLWTAIWYLYWSKLSFFYTTSAIKLKLDCVLGLFCLTLKCVDVYKPNAAFMSVACLGKNSNACTSVLLRTWSPDVFLSKPLRSCKHVSSKLPAVFSACNL